MKLKPRNTALNSRALLYKRYTSIENSYNKHILYLSPRRRTGWVFNRENLEFVLVGEAKDIPTYEYDEVVDIREHNYYRYEDYVFIFYRSQDTGEDTWVRRPLTQEDIDSGITGMIKSSNIAKYQKNKYFYAGSFDYMIKGESEGTVTQYIKGALIPMESFNIKYFSDDLELEEDDLVVVDGKLYSLENIITVQKRQPKPYKVHFATLNSIL